MNNTQKSRDKLLVKVAHMYYIEGLSQKEIAERIFVSRSNVSRLLKTGREKGIVEIRINHPSHIFLRLESEIKNRFGLDEVFVISSGQSSNDTLVELGKTAARCLESNLENGMLVGLSWGRSLYYTVEAFRPTRRDGVEVVQLLGGSGARDINTDGFELARKLARALNARCHFLQVSLVVRNKNVRDILMQESDIMGPLQKGKRTDLAIVGVGSNNPETSAMVRSGYLTAAESEELAKQGVVGDICGYQLDINGNVCQVELNERIVGVSPHDIKRIPKVIGVAAGADKAPVLLGALRGGYINILVTDESAALGLLNIEVGSTEGKSLYDLF
ncbi:MAG: sugar-binding transcriptional regulator [Firmicutes bacterium]|nr:sugar-binding transcriptional regulator [Bacillota bacterium]